MGSTENCILSLGVNVQKSLRTTDLDDLSNELNNIKAGCYIGEVLLNHLTFADV